MVPSSSQNDLPLHILALNEKDGSSWMKVTSQSQRERLQKQRMINIRAGLSTSAASPITESYPVSLFRTMFRESMTRNIQKCTLAEAERSTKNNGWNGTLDDLGIFVGLTIARRILDHRDLPLCRLWNKSWGCPMFNKTMSRSMCFEIMRFLCLNPKRE